MVDTHKESSGSVNLLDLNSQTRNNIKNTQRGQIDDSVVKSTVLGVLTEDPGSILSTHKEANNHV